MNFDSRSLEDTQRLGKLIGQKLQLGDIILLFGDLGAGKTTLTQNIVLGLGTSEDEYVSSPTFTIVNHYLGRFPIYHIDLYRIDSQHALENLGLEEFLFGDGVTIIEWAEKLIHSETNQILLGIKSRLEIHIEINSYDTRIMNIQSFGLKNRIPYI